MAKVRLIVEITEESSPTMRWERQFPLGSGAPFELLGRAFEVLQREDPLPFPQSLAAFLRGALVAKQDVTDALDSIP